MNIFDYRFLTTLSGFGYSIAASAAPAYVVEMSHPAYRDVLTGLYNCQYFIGAIAAAGACRGCLVYPDSRAWRIPIWCQLITSSFVVAFVWLIPESPRWLYSHGHNEKAWDVITKYHGDGSRDNAFVTLQIREYEEAINIEGSDKRAWDFRELVNTKAARWRLVCVGIASFLSQWAQGGITTYYMGGLLESAGVTDTSRVLDVNLGYTVLSAAGAYMGGFFAPKLRRRPMLIGASIACCVSLYLLDSIPWCLFLANSNLIRLALLGCRPPLVYTHSRRMHPPPQRQLLLFSLLAFPIALVGHHYKPCILLSV
jgi:MFS family permease